jgi:hypothetical protein
MTTRPDPLPFALSDVALLLVAQQALSFIGLTLSRVKT